MEQDTSVSCASCNTSNMEGTTVCAACGDKMASNCGDMANEVKCECNPNGKMSSTECATECATDCATNCATDSASCATDCATDNTANCACNKNMENPRYRDVPGEDVPDGRDDRGMPSDGRPRPDAPRHIERRDGERDYACNGSETMSVEMGMNKISEMSDRIKELEAQNKAYMAKIESMADYENLKQYRQDNEKRIKMEADMATMNTVMSEIASRGYSMSDEEKNKFISKFSEFNSADAWSNYVKAQVFDNCNNSSKVQQIGLPFAELKKTNSIWDSI